MSRAIFDQAILALPIYDDKHRKLAERLTEWVDDMGKQALALIGDDIDATGKTITHFLGQHRFFQFGCSGDADDIRSITLKRQALAYLDDLLDFYYSIQCLSAWTLVNHGSEALKKQYLPSMQTGELIGCFAVSERHSGSDMSQVHVKADKNNDEFTINGEKVWIANARIADICFLLTKTTEGLGPLGLSMLAVPLNNTGVQCSPNLDTIACRVLGDIHFTDTPIATDHVVGAQGTGLPIAVDILEHFRVTVGAAASGFSRKALHKALAFSKQRTIAGEQLSQKQITQIRFSEIAVSLNTASLLIAQAAWEIDNKTNTRGPRSSMAKLYATEQAQSIIDSCMQLLGAQGVAITSGIEKLYREIRPMRIYEGTSEVQSLIVGQAVVSGNL